MFADIAKIFIKSGKGGNGHVSFRRELFVPAGGPDGGDGGKGGDIIVEVDKGMNTLEDFRNRQKYVATPGEEGGGKRMHGKNGKDLVIKVPEGTIIRDFETKKIIADMSGDNQRLVLLKGGKGGLGNMHFATPSMQAPKFAQPGQDARELWVQLELRVIADVGLVGLPNVGKSTILSMCSNARPEIANYHFTTLTPHLGVVGLKGDRSFVMADIPGLIEGASEGVGLGHEFLRHVERCRLIVHVVDVSGIEGRDPCEDFEVINAELAKFNEELAERPQIVAANKADMATEEQIAAFRSYIESKGLPFFCISAATTQGTSELMNKVSEVLDTLPPIKEFEAEPIPQEELDEMLGVDKKFTIEVEDDVYYVEAPWIQPIMRTVDPDDYSSLQYFQRVLINSGIIAKLEEMGIKEGDTVSLEGFEFDFVY